MYNRHIKRKCPEESALNIVPGRVVCVGEEEVRQLALPDPALGVRLLPRELQAQDLTLQPRHRSPVTICPRSGYPSYIVTYYIKLLLGHIVALHKAV